MRPFVAGFIESKSREFFAQIFLAYYLVNKGYDFLLGSQAAIRFAAPQLPPGVFIENGLSQERCSRLTKLKSHGWKILSLCHECYSGISIDHYIRERLDPDSTRLADAILLLGDRLYDGIVDRRPDLKDKLFVTGNPRFDFLLPPLSRIYKKEALEIIEKHGKFFLFNSNFNSIPHSHELINGLEGFIGAYCPDKDTYNNRLSLFKCDEERLGYVLSELTSLARRFQNISLIIRPHPSEDHEFWRRIVRSLSLRNVMVIHSGDVRPWLMAAQCVIHSNCMTGLEALLLNKPAYNIDYPQSSVKYFTLPASLSNPYDRLASDLEETCRKSLTFTGLRSISEFIRLPSSNPEKDYSANAISKILDSLAPFERYPSHKLLHASELAMRSFKQPTDILTRQYIPSIELSEINEIVLRLSTCLPGLAPPSVSQVGDHCFYFTE